MVAIEILLGDKKATDVVGVGELLRNRCAYLIGTTRDDRDTILEKFGQVYSVRSKIVHEGKTRLNLEERTLFRWLQWVCQRVIQEELKLLSTR